MLEILILICCLIADQITKHWSAEVLAAMPDRTIPIIQDVLHFTYVENRGAAFGLMQNKRMFFIISTVIICVAIVVLMIVKRRELDRWMRTALSLMLCGAIGNFIDRLILAYVRDFIDFRLINFPVFNIADICLTVSVIMFAIHILFMEKPGNENSLKKESKNTKDA